MRGQATSFDCTVVSLQIRRDFDFPHRIWRLATALASMPSTLSSKVVDTTSPNFRGSIYFVRFRTFVGRLINFIAVWKSFKNTRRALDRLPLGRCKRQNPLVASPRLREGPLFSLAPIVRSGASCCRSGSSPKPVRAGHRPERVRAGSTHADARFVFKSPYLRSALVEPVFLSSAFPQPSLQW